MLLSKIIILIYSLLLAITICPKCLASSAADGYEVAIVESFRTGGDHFRVSHQKQTITRARVEKRYDAQKQSETTSWLLVFLSPLKGAASLYAGNYAAAVSALSLEAAGLIGGIAYFSSTSNKKGGASTSQLIRENAPQAFAASAIALAGISSAMAIDSLGGPAAISAKNKKLEREKQIHLNGIALNFGSSISTPAVTMDFSF